MGQCNTREKPEQGRQGCRETTWDSISIYKLRNAVTATETIAYLPRLNKIGSLRHVKNKTIPVRLLKLQVNVQFYNF